MRVEKPNYIETPWGPEEVCPHCGSSLQWHDCENCQDGYTHHDCGEDTCCCLYPEPNVPCWICHGKGGWWDCIGECEKK